MFGCGAGGRLKLADALSRTAEITVLAEVSFVIISKLQGLRSSDGERFYSRAAQIRNQAGEIRTAARR